MCTYLPVWVEAQCLYSYCSFFDTGSVLVFIAMTMYPDEDIYKKKHLIWGLEVPQG